MTDIKIMLMTEYVIKIINCSTNTHDLCAHR